MPTNRGPTQGERICRGAIVTFARSSHRWPIILPYLSPKHERVAAAIAEHDLKVTGLLMHHYIRNNCAVLKTQLP